MGCVFSSNGSNHQNVAITRAVHTEDGSAERSRQMNCSTRKEKTEETHCDADTNEWKANLGEKPNERQLKAEEDNSKAFDTERL